MNKKFQSKDPNFNAVKAFHALMDGHTQDRPQAFDLTLASHRAGFKLEELVEFLQATAPDRQAFLEAISDLHAALDQAVSKVADRLIPDAPLTGQVDALMDLLYFVYGSFVLLGVDPAPIFDIVHQANMGKIFPDGKAHFDPVTHKILKPHDWQARFAPELAIEAKLARQGDFIATKILRSLF